MPEYPNIYYLYGMNVKSNRWELVGHNIGISTLEYIKESYADYYSDWYKSAKPVALDWF
jgi:hypothetical protein